MNQSSDFYGSVIGPIEDRMIRSVWRITRNDEDAQDAMQNALLTIWKQRNRIGRHAAPQALILKICVNAACDTARRRSRQGARAEPQTEAVAVLVDGAATPPEDLAQKELCEEILSAIGRLSLRQAVAISLRVLEGLSYGEIAEAMDCAEVTARKHVERARDHLRVALSEHAPTPHARSSRWIRT